MATESKTAEKKMWSTPKLLVLLVQKAERGNRTMLVDQSVPASNGS